MTKWEMIHLPNRLTSRVSEQFFAFICQVEWGVPPAETAHLLGYKLLRPEEPQVEQRQAKQVGETNR